MSSVSTCLIEKNVFFREGLKTLLRGTEFEIVESCTDVVSAEKLEHKEISLIIMGVDDLEGHTVFSVVKRMFPNSRIVLLTDQIDARNIISVFTAGVDGCLLRDVAPAALIGSLNMVMAGEKVCPAALLKMLVKNIETNDRSDTGFSGRHLSLRETEVLKYLAFGETNKQIARDLDITEATVKVHIKTVLRKLDLSNRTQAAVWAVNRGLVSKHQRTG